MKLNVDVNIESCTTMEDRQQQNVHLFIQNLKIIIISKANKTNYNL